MPLGAPVLSPGAQDLPQVQADEIEALQSILGSDFASGQQSGQAATAWGNAGINQPLFTLTIRPDEDRYKDQVFVKVEIRLPKRYPRIPLISSVPPTPKDGAVLNVTSQQLSQLASVLKQRATELAAKGEEAIWEVYSCGAELLSNENLVKAREKEAEREMEAKKKSEMIPSLEEEKQRREGEGEKIKAQELNRQLEADRKTSDAKASSLAKVIAEKEEAIRVEKERRRVGFEADAPQSEAAVVFGRTPSFERFASSPDEPRPLSPPANKLLRAVASGVAMEGPAFLDFDPPLSLARGTTESRFQISPVVQDSYDTISTHQYAIPLSAASGSPQSLDTITITSPYFSTSRGRRKLAGLERELEGLASISYPGLRQMRGFRLRRIDHPRLATPSDSEGYFTLSIVSAPPSRLEVRLDSLLLVQPLPVAKVFDLAKDIFAGAEELHGRGLLLKDVTLDRICLVPNQGFIIDTVWKGSVLDLHRGNPFREAAEPAGERWTGDWVVPELQSELRYSRKSDTFALGRVLLLSLMGIAASASFGDPWAALHAAQSCGTLDEVSAKFLGKVLDRSARKRPTPAEALKYLQSILHLGADNGRAYLDVPTTDSIRPRAPADAQINASADMPTPALTRSSFFSSRPAATAPQGGPGSSRFLSDFIPLSILGKGAFGVVSKVRNRLDGGVYAVKKIKLDGGIGEAGEGEEKTLREIGALARVNHPHVTRYYAAWIEEASALSSDLDGATSETTATESGIATTSASSNAATDTGAAAQMSFSLSFGPPKDADFDDIARAEEEDFLSHVGFEEEDASSSQSSESEFDEEEGSSEEEPSHRGRVTERAVNRSKSRSALNGAGVKRGQQAPRWLYIQMELVDDVTLRELIEKGPIGVDDCWRLLRQILNALVHIHNLGIVHRDLKPSNILMAGQDVKIGDFGLATTLETVPTLAEGSSIASSGVLPPVRSDHHQHQFDSSGRILLEGSDDMTGEVGTALYTAPEIVRKQGARYGYKVDMYSLGIILFEMFASGRVYSTGMERVQRLRSLRQTVSEFPPAWPSELVKERQVIEWLVTHKAEDRPSPLELLQSDLLPPRLEDESVQETLRLVTDHSSVYHLQLLDALFAPQPPADEEIRDVTFDAGSQQQIRTKSGDSREHLVDPRESVVVEFLRTVFLRHGAVELQAPLLMPPRSGLYSSVKEGPSGNTPVQLLDSTGQVVFLPRDHLVPFARIIARSRNHRLKRFCIGPVYRDSLLAGGQPLSILAANMDIIVGAGGNLPSAAEGECLACLEEILGEVPGFKSDWVVLINHGTILNLLLERVPVKQHSTLLSTLSALSGHQAGSTAASIRQKLSQQLNLPRSLADELEACALMAEDIETARNRLEKILPVDHRPALVKAVQAILEVRDAARKLGVPVERRFLLCPLLSNYSHCYQGSVFFQVARGPGSSGRKRRRARWDVVASGGRYSSLIARFATPLSGPPPSGVGLQLAVSKLISALAKDQEINELRRPPDLWTPRRADVYVHSSPGMLELRMAICRELWSHGIRADLSYEDDVGQDSNMLTTAARCKEEGFSFLIFGTTRGLMKVRSLWTKMVEGEFVSMLELVPWLLDQLARAAGNAGPGGIGPPAGAAFDSTGVQGSDTQSLAANATSGMATGFQASAGLGSASGDLSISGTATNLAPAMMETQIVLPVHASSSRRPDKSDKSNHSHPDRRVKLASNHPIINSATTQVHKMATSLAAGEVPVIAVDLRGDIFDALCVAAMGKDTARRDIGWRAFLDTLGSGEEKEYAKSIRGHIEKCGDGLVILWSIREKRAAVVGSNGPGI